MEYTTSPVDEAFLALTDDGLYLSASECRENTCYWVNSRTIGAIALCKGLNRHGWLGFEGLACNRGHDYLFTEYHCDSSQLYGTIKPILAIEAAPELADTHETMKWLLEKNIELHVDYLDWLLQMPEALKRSRYYDNTVEDSSELLAWLLKKQQAGFSCVIPD